MKIETGFRRISVSNTPVTYRYPRLFLAWVGSEAEVSILAKCSPMAGKTKTTGLSIDITLRFLGFGLELQLSTVLARSLFGNSQRMLIMENECTLVGVPIVMRFDRV